MLRTHAPSCHTFTLHNCMSISPSQTHLRRLEGVVSRKVNVKEEYSSLVWRPCSRDMYGERTIQLQTVNDRPARERLTDLTAPRLSIPIQRCCRPLGRLNSYLGDPEKSRRAPSGCAWQPTTDQCPSVLKTSVSKHNWMLYELGGDTEGPSRASCEPATLSASARSKRLPLAVKQ